MENDKLKADLDASQVDSLQNYNKGIGWTTYTTWRGSYIAYLHTMLESSLSTTMPR